MRSVSGPFGPFQSIIGSACYFSQVGSVLGQIDPLGTPCGCLKGPRVGQYALLLCIIHVRRVSGPFGPFQSIIGSPCNFGQIASVFRPNRHFWDPLWVSKRTQGGPICLTIMYYICETYFRAIWTFQSIIGTAC